MLCDWPLQKQHEVEPGEEHGHSGTLPLHFARVVGEEGADEETTGDVQHPLQGVIGVHEVTESLATQIPFTFSLSIIMIIDIKSCLLEINSRLTLFSTVTHSHFYSIGDKYE